MHIDLIWITREFDSFPHWPHGRVYLAPPTAAGVQACVRLVLDDTTEGHCLFWDAALGLPDMERLRAAATLPGDGWHAGLRLGLGGQPRLLDVVDPVWPLNRDPRPDQTATSWRLSLRCCLVKTAVLAQLGGPDPAFDTLSGASLELGHRWIRQGAFLTHVPALLADAAPAAGPAPSLADAFRLVHGRYGRIWSAWALGRAVVTGTPARAALAAWRTARQYRPAHGRGCYRSSDAGAGASPQLQRVSVLIPTLDRYLYLFRVLEQLRAQTVRPWEIIVVDQTEAARRDPSWPQRFADLPLRTLWRDVAGQSSARNAGLRHATGDAVLFLDDDDEIGADLVEQHLDCLNRSGMDASCGVAEEAGSGPLPHEFTIRRAADVFPTNNTLLRRTALHASGLFDLAFEHGPRADADLGMRLTLSGARLLLNPAARVMHLHAPRGGLRSHKARAVTRGGSRRTIARRHLLSTTEAYFWLRYFTPRQVAEARLIRSVASLRGEGGSAQRLLRAAVMLLRLPGTYRENGRRLDHGRALLSTFPAIPSLPDGALEDHPATPDRETLPCI